MTRVDAVTKLINVNGVTAPNGPSVLRRNRTG
jgi:hypothetical protein